VRVMNGVGCEKFAEQAFHFADNLVSEKSGGRCFATSCEVREHGANSAIYEA
jgi:6-pyruvoyltetrahydropterin/6-carboxytetrahydropterin synthase